MAQALSSTPPLRFGGQIPLCAHSTDTPRHRGCTPRAVLPCARSWGWVHIGDIWGDVSRSLGGTELSPRGFAGRFGFMFLLLIPILPHFVVNSACFVSRAAAWPWGSTDRAAPSTGRCPKTAPTFRAGGAQGLNDFPEASSVFVIRPERGNFPRLNLAGAVPGREQPAAGHLHPAPLLPPTVAASRNLGEIV